jgi:hypothetical protein
VAAAFGKGKAQLFKELQRTAIVFTASRQGIAMNQESHPEARVAQGRGGA